MDILYKLKYSLYFIRLFGIEIYTVKPTSSVLPMTSTFEQKEKWKTVDYA